MNSCSFKNINYFIHTVYLINLLEPCSRFNGSSFQSRHILKQNGDPNPNPLHMLGVQSQGSLHVTLPFLSTLQGLSRLPPEDFAVFPADWSPAGGHSSSWCPLCVTLLFPSGL